MQSALRYTFYIPIDRVPNSKSQFYNEKLENQRDGLLRLLWK